MPMNDKHDGREVHVDSYVDEGEYKVTMPFKSKDFNTDRFKQYEEIRKSLAKKTMTMYKGYMQSENTMHLK